MTMERLAVQMYTLRHVTESLDEVLAQLAACGYSGIETFGPLEPAASELASLLQKHGLRVVSAHVALEMLESDADAVIAWHRALGNETLAVPWLSPEQRPVDAAGWIAFGRRLGELGARYRASGMRLLYHNHDFEIVEYDGRLAVELLLDGAGGENLGAEVDVAWVVRAGQDPAPLLKRLAGRCPRIHAKDVARPGQNPGEEGHADVGDGVIDWDPLLAAARLAGVEWIVVEHDQPREPMRTIRRSAQFLSARWP